MKWDGSIRNVLLKNEVDYFNLYTIFDILEKTLKSFEYRFLEWKKIWNFPWTMKSL